MILADPLTVTVYSTSACMACKQTKRRLDELGIPYTETRIDKGSDDSEVRGFIAALAARHTPGRVFSHAPVVHVTGPGGEQAWDGFRIDRINALAGT